MGQPQKTFPKILIIFFMVLISFIVSLGLSNLNFMRGFEDQLINLRFAWKNHLEPAERIQEGVIKEGDKVDSDIMIIGIDETSLSSDFLGPWPWERKVHADFLKYFRYDNGKYAPHFVLFDIFFDQYRQSTANEEFVENLAAYLYDNDISAKDKTGFLDKAKAAYYKVPTADQVLFEEMKHHDNVFFDYLSQYGEEERLSAEELAPRVQELLKHHLPLKKPGLHKGEYVVENPEVYMKTRVAKRMSPVISDVKPPVVEIMKEAQGVGSAWVEADLDGSIRKMPLVFLYDDERVISEPVFLPTIDLIFVIQYFKASVKDIEVVFGKHIKIKDAIIPIKEKDEEGGYKTIKEIKQDVVIPIDKEGKMHINFQGESHSFENMSYAFVNADVDNDNAALYKNRTLLIGFYSTAGLGETKDYFNTPYGSMYGIEIHANAIETILKRDFIKPVSVAVQYLITIFLILAVAILFFRFNIIKGLIIAVVGLILVFSFSGLAFAGSIFGLNIFKAPLYLLNMTIPLSAVLTSLIINISYKVLTEEKDKKFLKSTFSQYISPELIDIMYEAKTMPQLGGSSDIITAYFTDIQGFSTFSEKLTAPQVVELLNEYLSTMTDILIEEKGTLDKYEGDAIIAFFGAPMKFSDNAVRACKVAIKMQDALGDLRRKWKSEISDENRNTKNLSAEHWVPGDKWPKIVHDMRMRIGINTGEIVTGNMGSKMRMNYTMMGDSVNLAARLESGAKQYGVFSLISEMTFKHAFLDEEGQEHLVSDFFEARFLDRLTVVGKSEPVAVYELISLKGELTEDEKKLLSLFDKAMKLYQETKWDEAKELFLEASKVERFPEHKLTPSLLFAMRCEEFKNNPPVPKGEVWDGVYRLDSK